MPSDFLPIHSTALSTISQKRKDLLGPSSTAKATRLENLTLRFQARLKNFDSRVCPPALAKDPTFGTKTAQHKIIRNALGWLHIADSRYINSPNQGPRRVDRAAVLSMHCPRDGGTASARSFSDDFRVVPGTLSSSTRQHRPAQVRNFEKKVIWQDALHRSSKSGSTPSRSSSINTFRSDAQDQRDKAGENFIAITPPDLFLKFGAGEQVRDILRIPTSGRYSALSTLALSRRNYGSHIEHLLYRAERMRHSCDSVVPPEDIRGRARRHVGEAGQTGPG